MKTEIHPTYHAKAKIACACGNEIVVGSTVETIKVELCAECHPFYTGKQKLVDTARRVEKFKAKMAKQEEVAQKRRGKKAKRAARAKAKHAEETSAEKKTKKAAADK